MIVIVINCVEEKVKENLKKRAEFTKALIENEKRRFAEALLKHENEVIIPKRAIEQYRIKYPKGTKLDELVVVSDPYYREQLKQYCVDTINLKTSLRVTLVINAMLPISSIEKPTAMVLNNEGKWVHVYTSTPNTQFSYAR